MTLFQSFTAATRPEDGPPRLARLRVAMREAGLDGFLVPRADAHQGEYVARCDERLAWLTGFTGSAGFAAVLADVAGVFVDGRYRLQVKTQVAPDFTPVAWPDTKLADWLMEKLPAGGRVGFDPWLHTAKEIEGLRERVATRGIAIEPTDNLVDAIWENRPPPPAEPLEAYPDALAGETAEAKRARIGKALADAGQAAAVLTQPDSIAWLLNLRGADLPRVPVAQAFAILSADGRVELFLEPRDTSELAGHLGPEVAVLPREGFVAALTQLAGPVRVDRERAPLKVATVLDEAEVARVWGEDPCLLPKAQKTDAEIEATVEAHLRDGAAMVAFLAWLDGRAEAVLAGERVTETDIVRGLEGFRRATNLLRDISFDAIVGAGPHAAINHYRVTEETDRALAAGELLLIDSGGQYLEGTTDVTRTVAIGAPTEEHRLCFTRVLKGMIAISTARWPKGLAGRDLDALARIALWRAGQDYDHGTGHGVGVFLSVHEGPQRLSRLSEVPLVPGMILSNEPGYYREGAFGIRIENLVAVENAPALPGGDDRAMLAFRTLTFVPIDRRLIEPGLLDRDERAWLDAYHAEVRARIGPRADAEVRDWLERATAPL